MPAEVSTDINALIKQLAKKDPFLYQVVMLLTTQIEDIRQLLEPLIDLTVTPSVTQVPADVTGFSYSFGPDFVRLNWDHSITPKNYEVRLGSDWDTASLVVKTDSDQAILEPLLVGSYTYLIKAISTEGTYSETATSLNVVVPQLGTAVISAQVIDNNVLLTWTDADSIFQIDHYNVFKDGNLVGTKKGNFTTIFETVSGTYAYSVQAVDIIDNEGPVSLAFTVDVRQPPDFVLYDSLTDSAIDGTKVNTYKDPTDNRLKGCRLVTETWATHFTNNAWTTIQAQINAGYPYYSEPNETTGSYEKKFDFGTILTSIIVNVAWDFEQTDGNTTVVCKIKYSDDDITYTAYVAGTSIFATSLRYVKVKLEFSGDSDSLFALSNLRCLLDVKREQDGGTVDVLAADAGGTEVFFNKTFKDIDSITLTPLSTTLIIAIFDFTDIPNPTSFFIYAFDSAGVRVDATISWACRGIT